MCLVDLRLVCTSVVWLTKFTHDHTIQRMIIQSNLQAYNLCYLTLLSLSLQAGKERKRREKERRKGEENASKETSKIGFFLTFQSFNFAIFSGGCRPLTPLLGGCAPKPRWKVLKLTLQDLCNARINTVLDTILMVKQLQNNMFV